MSNASEKIHTLNGNAGCPSVDVLLTTFNGAAYLSQQIASLGKQEDVCVRVIQSDDGSTDGSIDIAVAAAHHCALEIRALAAHAPTGSAARNFFLLFKETDFSSCDFVALCDQDDIWPTNKLARACAELHRTGADAYSCSSIAFWPDGRERLIRKDYPQRSFDMLFESASHGCTYVLTASTAQAFAKELSRLGPKIDQVDFHDWLLYAWCRATGRKWHFDPLALIRYRQSGKNVIGANVGVAALRSRLRLLRNGWLRQQALLIADCIGWSAHPLVGRLRRMNWRDRLILAFKARQCRRRPRDQLMFFVACLTTGI